MKRLSTLGKSVKRRTSHSALLQFSNRRELQFHVRLTLHELTHIPSGVGILYAKWKTAGNLAQACTKQIRIRDNTVTWEETFEFDCRLTVNNGTNLVDTCPVRVSIRQVRLRGSIN